MDFRRWLAAVVVSLLAACTGSPATAPEADTQAEGPVEDRGLEAVYAEVEGLTGTDRREALISLAQAEDGEFVLYNSQNLDDFGPISDAFEEAVGIEPSLYRASAATMRQRILQEARAGQSSADVIQMSSQEMMILHREGLLSPLHSPATDDILSSAVFDTWAGTWLNVFIAAWNTDAVPPNEAPQDWEDVLTDYDGRIALESTDWDWFATLVNDYFVEERGMAEEEAIDLFKGAAAGGAAFEGHTAMAELLVTGEFDVAPSLYLDRVTQMKAAGAPIEWQEPVEPLVILPDAIAISAETDNPAKALLYVEYMLTDGQQMLVDAGLTPASTAVGAGLESYETLLVDLDALIDEQDRWQTLYEEIIGGAGG